MNRKTTNFRKLDKWHLWCFCWDICAKRVPKHIKKCRMYIFKNYMSPAIPYWINEYHYTHVLYKKHPEYNTGDRSCTLAEFPPRKRKKRLKP